MARRVPKKLRWDHPEFDDFLKFKAHLGKRPDTHFDMDWQPYWDKPELGVSETCLRLLKDTVKKLKDIGYFSVADDVESGIEMLNKYRLYAVWAKKTKEFESELCFDWDDYVALLTAEIIHKPLDDGDIPF